MTTEPLLDFDMLVFNKIINEKLSGYLLDYITKEFESIISCPPPKPTCNFNPTNLPSPPLSHSSLNYSSNQSIPLTPPPAYEVQDTHKPSLSPPMPLRNYIEQVMTKSKLDIGTLLMSLSYVRRLRLKLYKTSKGMECTHHRIFIATLTIAHKYMHDAAIKNKYWVDYALQLFSNTEINLMEKQLLQLLDYNLTISDENKIIKDIVEIYSAHDSTQHLSSPSLTCDSAYASQTSSNRSSYCS